MVSKWLRRTIAPLGLAAVGCVGDFPVSAVDGDPAAQPSGGSGQHSFGPGTGGTVLASGGSTIGRPPVETGFPEGEQAALDTPAASTRFARLTRQQWQNSVTDLLRLQEPVHQIDLLREDPRQSGFLFDNDGSALAVDDALLGGLQRAASELAARVTGDAVQLEALVGDLPGDMTAKRDAFIERFALRAHRHPIDSVDRALYQSLFEQGTDLYDLQNPFTAGVRAVVEGALQSPFFLYRVEQSSTVSGSVIPLDAYEVASRLSYALWNTMPDDQLLEAAAQGDLVRVGTLETQARRMLADERAAAVLLSFHDQLLNADKFDDIKPSPDVYDVSDQFPQHARTEQSMFVHEVVFAQQGGLRDLLTSRQTFVNRELAEVYAVNGDYGDNFEPATLDSRRAGIFGHVGFLASNATSVDPDPIHRGKFLAERMACLAIAAPPVNVPAPPRASNKTNRQRIEEFTEADGSECSACHKPLINPFGFPFESFDAIGAYRDTDQGMPVQTDASPILDATPTPVDNAVELAQAMAESPGVHACYAKHALEFIYGRHRATSDKPLLARISKLSHTDDAAVRDIVLNLILTEAFIARGQETEQ